MPTRRNLSAAAEHVDRLLNLERQAWLLGAGISLRAGIPLMWPLTKRVRSILANPQSIIDEDTAATNELLSTVCDQMPDDCHIEHYLSQIGDLISLAERKKEPVVVYGKKNFTADQLRTAHRHIQLAIRFTVEHGYIEARGRDPEKIGTTNDPIVDGTSHLQFVRALFHERRAGIERRPPIRFITTNYDCLLEDALARACVPFVDGFAGGATAFWDPRNTDARLNLFSAHEFHSATLSKLHGSIDWVVTEDDVVMRVRTSALVALKDPKNRLLIYPQATKYQVTQRDPFATLFADFRKVIAVKSPTLLAVCGYSFGDDHINEEIESALRHPSNTLTLLAFCNQDTDEHGNLRDNEGMPKVIAGWLQANAHWSERVLVAGRRGFYQGSLANQITPVPTADLPWWSFDGLTKFLKDGPETLP